jgi:glutaredoxin-related protein
MNIHITLYRSSLCPRCALARKFLQQLAAADPSIEIEEIDILASPRRTWRDGIRMIPAVKIGDDIASGLYLSKNDIAGFIARHRS